jgi:hypothetical protein
MPTIKKIAKTLGLFIDFNIPFALPYSRPWSGFAIQGASATFGRGAHPA